MSGDVICGDCLEVMPTLVADSVDSIVTDPPYGLSFMGKGWDRGVPGVEFWQAALRVAKPGSYLLAFGGTRTYHRLACAIEDAGFEIQDCLSWLYGSGFPKHKSKLKPAYEPIIVGRKPLEIHTVIGILAHTTTELVCLVNRQSKAGDSPERTDTSLFGLLLRSGYWNTASSLLECLAVISEHGNTFTIETATSLTTDLRILRSCLSRITQSTITEAGSQASGVESDAQLAAAISRSVIAKCERLVATTAGATAIGWLASEGIDPEVVSDAVAWEPIIMARKPAPKATLLNIDGCRIGTESTLGARSMSSFGLINDDGWQPKPGVNGSASGRWPANVLLDEEAAAVLDQQAGNVGGMAPASGPTHTGFSKSGSMSGHRNGMGDRAPAFHGDTGGASRFFYCAKASRSERNAGLEGLPKKHFAHSGGANDAIQRGETEYIADGIGLNKIQHAQNHHPTVKPVDLMRWLVRLVTPEGGLVLDPFTGSGSTGVAAIAEGRRFIGIEREAEYANIARRRIHSDNPLFTEVA